MSVQPCAIVGIGQTKHKKRRDDVSLPGLVREAAQRALDDAQLTWTDIDAVVLGKAPDPFEGVMMPELSMADALGAAGKPIMRVHTAGSVGGSTAIVASHLIQTGRHERVLTVAYEKQAEGNAQWGLAGGRSGGMGAGGIFAPWMRSFMARTGSPEHIGWKVAVKDRRNAAKNPYAHLQMPDLTIEEVLESPMLWDPIHCHESCPSSDGACALVLTNEDGADEVAEPAGVGARHRDAQRARHVPGPRPGAAAGRRRVRAHGARGRGDHEPARADRRRRALRAVLVVRADVARGPRPRRPRRGVEDHRVRRHEPRRQVPGEPVGRRALVEPDRRVGDAALRRGGAAGAGHGRRAPGRGRDGRARAGLRRRRAVLRDVGRRVVAWTPWSEKRA